MLARRGIAIKLATLMTIGIGVYLAPKAFSKTQRLCDGILPPNNMNIPVGAKVKVVHQFAADMLTGGLTEEQFNKVLDKVEKIYAPVIAQAGGKFVIVRNWTDGTVNAFAERQDGNWNINMFGGLARHPLVTEDGFALVACHETGHQIGGAPHFSSGGNDWAADEGGADYFGTLKCMRRYFAGDDNAKIIAGQQIDPVAAAKCKSEFTNVDDQNICLRTSLAGQSLGNLLAELGGSGQPSYATPDTSAVDTTYDGHPQAQCRLDTYLAGAVCHVDVSVPNSDTDYKQGSCVEPNDANGFRPHCWFKAD